ncbi:MAG TPA: serine hydrolase, partial [Herpetosiphonaceae bacterium]|nr:serine hydrolase [Herpetosiphonaceae bacterium]
YRYWFGRPVAFDAPFNRGSLPAGLLMASGEDMARYLIAQLNDGRYGSTTILSPAGTAEMQRGTVPIPGGVWGGFEEARYGMGWGGGQRNGVAAVGHPGDASNIHVDMILVPEGRWGVVLLMNSNNRVAPERMLAITDGVLSLVLGQQPPPVPDNWGMVDILRYVTALAMVQLLAMIWSVYTLRRLVRSAPGTVGGWLSIIRYVVAPLVFYLLLALVFLVGVRIIIPYPWPLLLISFPDLGTVTLVSGVAALGWAIIRTAVLVRLLRRRVPRVVPPPAAHARNVQAT